MARCIRENYWRYDGFVLIYGMDTMAYTAAALSYLAQGSPKPIILTGAQKPIGFESTDFKINLAVPPLRGGDMSGVFIMFNHKVILGTRTRKTRSKSFQAFSGINYADIGILRDGTLLRYIRQDCGAAVLHAGGQGYPLARGIGTEDALDHFTRQKDAGGAGFPAAPGPAGHGAALVVLPAGTVFLRVLHQGLSVCHVLRYTLAHEGYDLLSSSYNNL